MTRKCPCLRPSTSTVGRTLVKPFKDGGRARILCDPTLRLFNHIWKWSPSLERCVLVLFSVVSFGGLYAVVYHNPESAPCVADIVINDVPFYRLDRLSKNANGTSLTPFKFVVVNGQRFVEETAVCKKYWSVVDGFYFCVSTFWSVGYGDLIPNTPQMQFFVACWIQMLALGLGFLLGHGYATILEHSEQQYLAESGALLEPVPNVITAFQEGAKLPQHFWRIGLSALALSCLLFAGVVVFMVLEDWSFGDTLYFCITSLMTVGYGDVVPKTQSGRLFTAAWLTYCFVVVGGLIGNIFSARLDHAFRQQKLQIQDRPVSLRRISELDRTGNGVHSGDFLGLMLVLLQKVKWREINPVLDSFKNLDSEGKGYVTAEKLEPFRKQTETQFGFFGSSGLRSVRVHDQSESATGDQ